MSISNVGLAHLPLKAKLTLHTGDLHTHTHTHTHTHVRAHTHTLPLAESSRLKHKTHARTHTSPFPPSTPHQAMADKTPSSHSAQFHSPHRDKARISVLGRKVLMGLHPSPDPGYANTRRNAGAPTKGPVPHLSFALTIVLFPRRDPSHSPHVSLPPVTHKGP